jgi:AP-4 complex subunit beta-1
MAPSCLKDTGKVDALYSKIRDSDPVVVVTSLGVLDEVLKEEGGVVVNRPITHHLLGRLKDFPPWCLPQVLTILTRYDSFTAGHLHSLNKNSQHKK